MNEVCSYPPPPNHYMQFASGDSAMQPPDISGLGPTYRMFGQVAQNPAFPANANLPPAPIDRDVVMYDRAKGLKAEILRLVDSMPESVLNLLNAVQNKPNECSSQLRDFDNRIKSLFHALELMRPIEAQHVLLGISEREVSSRETLNENCREIIKNALTALNS